MPDGSRVMVESVTAFNARLDRMRIWLREQVQGALTEVGREGLNGDEAARIVAEVAADNVRAIRGDSQCMVLAQHVIDRAGQPLTGGHEQ
jgi:hypothetical protein